MSKANFEFGEHPGRLIKYVASKYLLCLPDGYDEDQNRAWPLVIFLHGAGERGTKVRKVALNGLPKVIRDGRRLPVVLLAPLCPAGQCWDDDEVLDLIDHIQSHHRVDENRLYITGLSMGGYGTWSLVVNHPEMWAAAAPICGGGSTIGILLASGSKLKALRGLPIHAFHGGKDDVVPPQESERMVAALKRIGCKNVDHTIYPEAGHDSWTETYANEQFIEWLLDQKKQKGTRRSGKSTKKPGKGR
jgi:predicted peptidase